MSKWLVTISIALALAAGGVQAAGDAAAGKAKSALCVACHGPDGNSPINPLWPKLSGQSPSYILKQLANFKSGARKNDLMSPMALPLSGQEQADLAAYFSSQTRNPGAAVADQVDLGEKIYRAGNSATGLAACMACHGPKGGGIPAAHFPGIGGQHAAYVEKALKDFRSGARINDPQQMMQDVTAKMTDTEIKAVAQYMQGLR